MDRQEAIARVVVSRRHRSTPGLGGTPTVNKINKPRQTYMKQITGLTGNTNDGILRFQSPLSKLESAQTDLVRRGLPKLFERDVQFPETRRDISVDIDGRRRRQS